MPTPHPISDQRKAELYADIEACTPGYIRSRQQARLERETARRARYALKMAAILNANEQADGQNAETQAEGHEDPMQEDDPRERARLATLWLTAALEAMHYTDVMIDWQRDGLQAQVLVHGTPVGTLLDVCDRFRQDDAFLPWLRSLVTEDPVLYAVHPFLAIETASLRTSSARLVEHLEAFLTDQTDPTGIRILNLRTMLDGVIRACTITDGLLERIEQRGAR